MANTGAVVVSAGVGKRMGTAVSKQYLPVGGKPIVAHALEAFERSTAVDAVVLVVGAADVGYGEELVREHGFRKVLRIVPGGAERQQSVRLGVEALTEALPGAEWVLVHDAARPLVTAELIERCLAGADASGAAVPGVPLKDTVKTANRDNIVVATPDRKSLWAVQTPQAFRVGLLLEAHRAAEADGFLGTDDAMLVERLGVEVKIAEGDPRNVKVTTPDDLEPVERWLAERAAVPPSEVKKGEKAMSIRVGQGFDVHAFAEGRKCIIGGVDIPFEKGLLGHSDADVLLHAVADAVLGALGLGDIGKHFPDTDAAYEGADSFVLLQNVWALAKKRGYRLGNVDCTIIAQRPKMLPHVPAMAANIARALEADVSAVNVKATTTERLGFPGREEGIAAQAVVLLQADG